MGPKWFYDHSQHSQHVRVPNVAFCPAEKPRICRLQHISCRVGFNMVGGMAWHFSVTEIAMIKLIKPPFFNGKFTRKSVEKQLITLINHEIMRWDSDNSPPFEENPPILWLPKSSIQSRNHPMCCASSIPKASQCLSRRNIRKWTWVNE